MPSQLTCEPYGRHWEPIANMAIGAEVVQISLCSMLKTKHPDSRPDARVQLDSAMTREAQEGDRRNAGELRV